MNGFAPPPWAQAPQPASAWQEHKTPEGRAYFYNPYTKVTQWSKPDELMTPAERALAKQPWKEYKTEAGRKYWHNTETKQSSWEMPEAYKAALGTPTTPAASTPKTPSAGFANDTYDQGRDHPAQAPLQLTYPTDPKARSFVPASNGPEFATTEEAEAAFAKLLKRSGVRPDWSWEQTIRATAKDSHFRAIKDPRDRKTAFKKFCDDVIAQEKQREKDRVAKLRSDFQTMLKRHPEIKHYTRWKTARQILESETIFRSTDSENERRQLFYEHLAGLKRDHKAEQSAKRSNALDALADLMNELQIELLDTRWEDVQRMLSDSQTFQNEEKFKNLSKLDVLATFRNHMQSVEHAFNRSKQEEKNRKYRKERQARDAFKSLLSELRQGEKINAATKWSEIVPLIENDERYTNMLANQGSTPQELFWDVIALEDRALRNSRVLVTDVLEDKRLELPSDFEEFLSMMRDDRRTAKIDADVLRVIHSRLREKLSSTKREDDRLQRRAIDDFRALLKRMPEPIDITDSYDKVRSTISRYPEFHRVATEDARRATFEKHIRRLAERKEEAGKRDRRRDHGRDRSVDRDRRSRDRSRDERSHRSSTRRRSRSPEVDAYEADRRKAIAERERNHRKSTMAENLLADDRDRGRPSPPPRRSRDRSRERSKRDYDADYDRHRERDRRPRDDDRERHWRRPVERGHSELNYGDDRPSGTRRRREDEDDYARRGSRDSKRPRRERSRERTPARTPARDTPAPRQKTPVPEQPPRDVRSGSEEGEIEEE